MNPQNRRGFTLIELVTVVVVIGVLSSIGTMRYLSLENDALTSKVGSEMQEIRLAALNYYTEHETWPAPASEGVIPLELAPLLSGATQFTTPHYTLEWRNVNGDDPAGIVGVVVRGTRAGLSQKLVQRLVYGSPYVGMGSDVMYIIKAPGIEM